MFKRVQKHVKKREESEALDIDAEIREALRLNESDSDDSDGSEESDSFDQQDDDESEEWGGLGYQDSDIGEDSDDMDDSMVENDDEDPHLSAVARRQVTFQVFTVDQALKEPIYAHPSRSNTSLCAFCPGKTLFGSLAISQHQGSKAHTRRSKRISELAALPENKGRDFCDLLKEMDGSKQQVETQGESKRAEKKRKAVEIRKVKRQKRKERKRAKEKQKQEVERKATNGERSTRQDHAALSEAKKSSDGKLKPKAGDKQTKQSGGEKMKPDIHAKTNKKKRKLERENEQEQGPGEKTHLPSKKRKTGADSIASSRGGAEITQQIKDIVKSATKRAHDALDKAHKGNGGVKTKDGRKRTG